MGEEIDSILAAKKELVERVRLRRKERGLSQAAMAKLSGVSFGSVKRFERTGEISLSSLLKIAKVVGCVTDFKRLFQGGTMSSVLKMRQAMLEQPQAISVTWN